MNNNFDRGFGEGYKDGRIGVTKNLDENTHTWDSAYSQGYNYGYSIGNYRRLNNGQDHIQTLID